MAFSIKLKDRDFTAIPIPPDLEITVIDYSESATMGYLDATIHISGSVESLMQVMNWLRYGIEIVNDFGTTVWSGCISDIDVNAGAISDRFTLRNMYNRIKAVYSNNVQGWQRNDTDWVEDSTSVDRYGEKEAIISLGDSTEEIADASLNILIDKYGKPTALPVFESSQPGATIFCKGLASTLEWKYFTRHEGRIENTNSSNSGNFTVGWKISSSTRVNFYGSSVTYTRTVTGATNATPIVITTSSAHALNSGDIVTISGVGGNTAANGTYKVTVVSSTTFQLKDQSTGADIAGNGSYTSGGTVSRTISNPSDSEIVFGLKITNATNATPIVITCASHGLSNGNTVTISHVEGNKAANGTFKIQNVTTNTFELIDATTGVSIVGNGDYATGGVLLTNNVFDYILSGQQVTVSGSTSNNSTFSAISDGSTNKLSVYAVPTTEFAGATVNVQLIGERIAQSFTGQAFTIDKVAVKAGLVGSPIDNLLVELHNDTAGVPGSTTHATATIPYTDLSDSVELIWANFDTAFTLVDGTTYWLVFKRSSSTSSVNHYLLGFDSSTYGTISFYNGSTWSTATTGTTIPFYLWGKEDIMAQLIRIIDDCGQFVSDIDSPTSHGISSNQYRTGDRTGLDEIIDLLATEGSNGRRLLMKIDKDRVLHIYAEPEELNINWYLTNDRKVKTINNQYLEQGILPVGQWLIRDGLPEGTDIMIQRNIFIEEATWNVEQERISQLRLKSSENFFS